MLGDFGRIASFWIMPTADMKARTSQNTSDIKREKATLPSTSSLEHGIDIPTSASFNDIGTIADRTERWTRTGL